MNATNCTVNGNSDATSTSNPLIINPKCINATEKEWKYDNYQSEAV